MEKETEISKWIEESAKAYSKKSTEGGEKLPKYSLYLEYAETDFKEGCKELLTHLFLQDQPDPKKYIQELSEREELGITIDTMFESIAKLQAENERLKEALKEILEGKGRYSSDKFTHAINTIDDMKTIAKEALKQQHDITRDRAKTA